MVGTTVPAAHLKCRTNTGQQSFEPIIGKQPRDKAIREKGDSRCQLAEAGSSWQE